MNKNKTTYNRFKYLLLLEMLLFNQKSENPNLKENILEKEFKNHLSQYFKMSDIEFNIHLKELASDLFIVYGEDGIGLTELGLQMAYLLKEMKYQSIYRGYKKKQKKEVDKHTLTFYHRHSFYILLELYNEAISLYKEAKERNQEVNFESCVKKYFNFNEILELTNYSEQSLDLHISYLLNKDLISPFEEYGENDQYGFTILGLSFVKILKDIKYQSIYSN